MKFPRQAFGLLVVLFAIPGNADDSAVYLGAQPAKRPHTPSLLRQWTEPPPSLPMSRLPLTDQAARVAQAPSAQGVGDLVRPDYPATTPSVDPAAIRYGAEIPQQPPGYGLAPTANVSPQYQYGATQAPSQPVTPAYASPYGTSHGYQGIYAPTTDPPVSSPYQTLGSENVMPLPAPSASVGIGNAATEVPTVDPVGIAPHVGVAPSIGVAPPVSDGGGLWGGFGGYQSGYAPQGYPMLPADTAPAATYVSSYVQSYAPAYAPSYGAVASVPSLGFTPAAAPAGCRSICGCDPCGPRGWFRADVMFGWLSGYDTPPLLTRNPAGTDIDYVGDLTSPSTHVVFGGNSIGDDVRIGGRLFGGYWFDDCRKWGIQADVFGIGNDNEDIVISSNGDPILSRPFYNTDPAYDGPDAQVLALGGVAAGEFTASSSSRLFSVAPALRFNICCCGGANQVVQCCDPCDPCCDPCAQGYAMGAAGCGRVGGGCGIGSWGRGVTASRVDLIAGYRFLQLKEGFSTQEVLYPTGPGYAPGTSFTLRDDINTKNDFHAFELGANWQLQRGRLLWDFGWSAAFGELTRRYTLNGSTAFYSPNGLSETVAGGFLVPPENIGSFESSKFTVMPQARIGVGYCIRKNIRLNAGYSFLYLDNVFRPGALMADEFDGRYLGVEPADGVVGSAKVDNDDEDVMLHALSIGISCNY